MNNSEFYKKIDGVFFKGSSRGWIAPGINTEALLCNVKSIAKKTTERIISKDSPDFFNSILPGIAERFSVNHNKPESQAGISDQGNYKYFRARQVDTWYILGENQAVEFWFLFAVKLGK